MKEYENEVKMRKACLKNERERRSCDAHQRALEREKKQVRAQMSREEDEVRANLRRLERERCSVDDRSDDDVETGAWTADLNALRSCTYTGYVLFSDRLKLFQQVSLSRVNLPSLASLLIRIQ